MHRISIALLIALSLRGQETRSSIFGRVADPSGSPVAAAAVTVTNTETNTAVRLKTNETGYYEAPLLMPGAYRVTAEMQGFKRTVRTNITLPVRSRTQVDLSLELGAVSESVSAKSRRLPPE
jgi:protocatechuate 3,4-dioxygenase beta subunit